MYGSPLIFPDSVSQLSDSVNSNLSSNGIGSYVIGSEEGQVILKRAYNVIPLTILFLAVLAYIIADWTIIKFIKNCFEDDKGNSKVLPISDSTKGTYRD